MKLTRKMFLTAATSVLLMSTTQAQSLKEINFGIISTDSSSALKSLWQPFLDDMGKATGLKINGFFATDYTGIIEGMRLIGVGFAPELRAICARQKGQKGIAERVLLIHSAFTTKDMVRHAIAKTVFKQHS